MMIVRGVCDWRDMEWASDKNRLVLVPYTAIMGLLTLAGMYLWWLESLKKPPEGNSVILNRKRRARRLGRIFFPISAFCLSGVFAFGSFVVWRTRNDFPAPASWPFIMGFICASAGSVVFAAIGIAAIVFYRPRPETPSRCAACQYDCAGIPDATVCPECGNALT
ncbi:MAG: hypothetical protein ACRDHN_19885 [Thermomicrobiales bacterium]